ncbi:hypothetical protein ABKN59_005346 [Abortiporus biennis]
MGIMLQSHQSFPWCVVVFHCESSMRSSPRAMPFVVGGNIDIKPTSINWIEMLTKNASISKSTYAVKHSQCGFDTAPIGAFGCSCSAREAALSAAEYGSVLSCFGLLDHGPRGASSVISISHASILSIANYRVRVGGGGCLSFDRIVNKVLRNF